MSVLIKSFYACLMLLFVSMNSNAAFLLEKTWKNHNYKFYSDQLSWADAKDFAANAGGYLLVVNTSVENDFIKSSLNSLSFVGSASDGGGAIYVWLGASDKEVEGEWKWQDGTSVPLIGMHSVWGNGPGHGSGSEPDNFQNQDCLAIGLEGWPTSDPGSYGSKGQWNDIDCSNKLGFIVEFDKIDNASSSSESFPDIPQQSLPKIIRTDGTVTDSSISSGASSDNGTTSSTTFTVDDKVTITAKVFPDSDDVGEEGELYVVMRSTVDGKKTFTALNAYGNWEVWNASLKSLPAAKYVQSLESAEEILIYSGTITAGDRLFYIGYSLFTSEGKPIITTSVSPFKLSVSDLEKADIAFVLRGYNGTTEYNSLASFRSDAKRALEGLSKLSFGEISSYKIFDGGIDPNSPDYYQSFEDIKAIDAALSGWTGSPWASYKERDAASGEILINPTDDEISVLQSLRRWLVENKKGAMQGWGKTQLGAVHYGLWVHDKVLRYGGTASMAFINGLRLPEGLNESNFKTIGIIFSSTDTYNTSAAQDSCNYFKIKKSDGQALPGGDVNGPQIYPTSREKQAATGDDLFTCFYSDYSDAYPETNTAESLAATNAYVTIHEAIHALGHSGHDSGDIPYSVMNQGKVDQYPIWDRVFIHGWLPESTITDDPTLIADTYGATDPNAKYLLRLGPQNDFDCISYVPVRIDGLDGVDSKLATDYNDIRKCHRYQELYNGNWVQYKAPYTEGGSTWNNIGVILEPLND